MTYRYNYHPKCQSGTSAPHLDSVCAPVGKICIIRIVFQSLKVIAKGFYMREHLSSNWNRQSIYDITLGSKSSGSDWLLLDGFDWPILVASQFRDLPSCYVQSFLVFPAL